MKLKLTSKTTMRQRTQVDRGTRSKGADGWDMTTMIRDASPERKRNVRQYHMSQAKTNRHGLLFTCAAALFACAITAASAGDGDPGSADALWRKLEPFTKPSEEFAGQFGNYRSPLRFADGSMAKTPGDWSRRRA